MNTTKISVKKQITIPQRIFSELNLNIGDYLEANVKAGKIILTPKKLISKDQEWFWTTEWQVKERGASEDIKKGRIKEFVNVNDLIRDLNA